MNKNLVIIASLVLVACKGDPEPCFRSGPLGNSAGSVFPCDLSEEQFYTQGDFEQSGLRVFHQLCFEANDCPMDCDPAEVLQTIEDDLIESSGRTGPGFEPNDILDRAELCFEAEVESDCCYSAVFLTPNPGEQP